MQRILKFVEKSSLVEEFKVHDFKTGEGFAYQKCRKAPSLSYGDIRHIYDIL